jgi:hypothetical protein
MSDTKEENKKYDINNGYIDYNNLYNNVRNENEASFDRRKGDGRRSGDKKKKTSPVPVYFVMVVIMIILTSFILAIELRMKADYEKINNELLFQITTNQQTNK